MAKTPQDVTRNPNNVCVLYNATVHPLIPFAVQGVIWYQGESDAWNAARYRVLLPTMIENRPD